MSVETCYMLYILWLMVLYWYYCDSVVVTGFCQHCGIQT